MPPFDPRDPAFEPRVRQSFARQSFLATIGARLARVAPGEVEIDLPARPDLQQQHGYLHAGAVTTIVDTACGYAALSLMPAGSAVLTAEFKLNLLAPATGERLVARGRVLKPGRMLFVCQGEVHAVRAGAEHLVAVMLATVAAVRDREIED